MLGLVVRSLEREQLVADLEFGPSFELFFIVLFVYAGANLHVAEIVQYWPAALVFVVARCAAKWIGVTGAGYALGAGVKQASSAGLRFSKRWVRRLRPERCAGPATSWMLAAALTPPRSIPPRRGAGIHRTAPRRQPPLARMPPSARPQPLRAIERLK